MRQWQVRSLVQALATYILLYSMMTLHQVPLLYAEDICGTARVSVKGTKHPECYYSVSYPMSRSGEGDSVPEPIHLESALSALGAQTSNHVLLRAYQI